MCSVPEGVGVRLAEKVMHVAVMVLDDVCGGDGRLAVGVEDVWEVTSLVAAGADFGDRRRHALVRVVEAVSVYLSVFAPPAGWDAGERMVDADLVWRHTDGRVFADVVSPLGVNAEAVWSKRTRGRPRRLVADGRDVFGDLFVGVRLVVPAAPVRSLLVTDRTVREPGRLCDAPVWFGPAVLGADAVAAAAAGGVS